MSNETERDEYISVLDILSVTRETKNILNEHKAELEESLLSIEEAYQTVIEAERRCVAIVLKGKKLVAFSENDKATN